MLKKLLITTALALALIMTPAMIQSEPPEKIVTVSESEFQKEIMIAGRITEDTFIQFMQATADKKIKHWTIHLITNGGCAFSTVGIITRINDMKQRGVEFTTVNRTKAFSAGGYLFLMGDKRITYEGSSFMFHTMMQQIPEYQREYARKSRPSFIAMVERLDQYIRDRFMEVTNCGKATADYFLNGKNPDGSDAGEGAQFMSGLTAYNMNVATEYVKFKN